MRENTIPLDNNFIVSDILLKMKETLVAIYVRLSKEDLNSGESESESIKNQKSMLMNYAMEKHWQIYNVYCDEDYSGAYAGEDNDRPDFNRMIADAEQGKFGIVLCKSQSRFSRNMEVIEQLIHGKFVEWNVRFVSIIDNADTEVKGNKKARQINSLINEWYLEDLSENIKAVFRDKMKHGEYLAAFPPYGYSKDDKHKNHLVINPHTSLVVKQIFEWHAEGYGAAKICRMLNDQGIPNPRKQQEIDGLRKTFFYGPDEIGPWSTTTIGDILNNQVYCGDVVQHLKEKISYKSKVTRKVAKDQRIIIPNMHEPIISREMFEETQERLGKRRKATGTGKVHILSGKVFCHYCGKPMQKNHSKNHIEYLRCRDKYAYASRDRCPTPNIRIDRILLALQIQLIDKFKNIAVDELDENITAMMLSKNDAKRNFNQTELERLVGENEKLEKNLRNLYSDRLNEIISVEQYMEYNKSLRERQSEIAGKISTLKQELDDGQDKCHTIEDVRKSVLYFLENHCIDREIIDNLVDRIEFGEINPETGSPKLKIFWAWD